MKILLINQYAGNKGDRAVLYATCRLLKTIDPSVEITVSTSDPDLWKGYDFYIENAISFVPNAWEFESQISSRRCYWSFIEKVKKYTFTLLRESYLAFSHFYFAKYLINPAFYKAAKQSDLVISLGGHHFTTLLSRDLVSSINYDAMSVLSIKKKLICFSQSFGPFLFHNPRNLALTHKILSSCSMLYPREREAEEELLRFGIPREKILPTFETVLSLNGLIKDHTPPSQRAKQVGISIYCTQQRSVNEQNSYVQTIVSMCDHATAQGYTVCFFPMELKGSGPDDRIMIYRILEHVSDKEHCSCIENDLPTKEHLQQIARCQIFVGHKTHSTIFALATGTPLIAIAYHPKTFKFMEQFDMSRYALDDKTLSATTLIEKFEQIRTEIDLVGLSEYKKAKECTGQIVRSIKHCLQ